MTPADIPREAVSVFDDVKRKQAGKVHHRPPIQVDSPVPIYSGGANTIDLL